MSSLIEASSLAKLEVKQQKKVLCCQVLGYGNQTGCLSKLVTSGTNLDSITSDGIQNSKNRFFFVSNSQTTGSLIVHVESQFAVVVQGL